jgi:hypothetical protein
MGQSYAQSSAQPSRAAAKQKTPRFRSEQQTVRSRTRDDADAKSGCPSGKSFASDEFASAFSFPTGNRKLQTTNYFCQPDQFDNTEIIAVPKNCSFHFSEFDISLPHPASSQRGVRAIVTIREVGMRWPCRVAARIRAPTNNIDADGEVVWSWPPGAEVKIAVLPDGHRERRGQRAGPRGDHV